MQAFLRRSALSPVCLPISVNVVPRFSRIPLLAYLIVAILLVVVVAALVTVTRTPPPSAQRLPNGSTFTLEKVQVITNSYQYSYQDGSKVLRRIAPWLPAFIRNRFSFGSASFGMGADGTNLVAVTILRHVGGTSSQAPSRLRVTDDQGNTFDACWGAHTLGMQNAVVNGWQIRSFPRRSRKIGLEFLIRNSKGDWRQLARFDVANPLFATHPQWTPEPLPATKQDGPLAVTLEEFTAGKPMSPERSGNDPATMPRKTRVLLSFTEDGESSHDWRVQKLTISDATGNRWFPYLDFVKQGFDWTTNGTIEFFGALWPGEEAWKLNCELTRISGFRPEETWQVSLSLPASATVATLTNRWQRGDQTVELIALASPETDHTGDFKWVAKWWGDEKDKVYALAIQLAPNIKERRLIVLNNATDSSGHDVKIVQHGSQDSSKQALFFKPGPDASMVRLTFALERSRFVEFMARPQPANARQ